MTSLINWKLDSIRPEDGGASCTPKTKLAPVPASPPWPPTAHAPCSLVIALQPRHSEQNDDC